MRDVTCESPGTRGGQKRRGVVTHVTARWLCAEAWPGPHESARAQNGERACVRTCRAALCLALGCLWECMSEHGYSGQ